MTRKNVKTVLGITAQISVGIVVGNIIRATVPIPQSTFNRVGCALGGFFVGTVLAQPLKKSTDELVDSMADAFNEQKEIKLTVV